MRQYAKFKSELANKVDLSRMFRVKKDIPVVMLFCLTITHSIWSTLKSLHPPQIKSDYWLLVRIMTHHSPKYKLSNIVNSFCPSSDYSSVLCLQITIFCWQINYLTNQITCGIFLLSAWDQSVAWQYWSSMRGAVHWHPALLKRVPNETCYAYQWLGSAW